MCVRGDSRDGFSLLLMQGEYISPEKIENIYLTSEIVGQVMIYGDTLKVGLRCLLPGIPPLLSLALVGTHNFLLSVDFLDNFFG